MKDGEIKESDFKAICGDMIAHGIRVPEDRTIIQISNAKQHLSAYFEYFLSMQDKKFIWQPEYDHVASWLENNEGRGLFLFGDCGRGKSMLCRYVIPALLLKLSRKVVSVYDAQEMNANIDDVLKKHILAIDDIGTEDTINNFGNKRLAFAELMDLAEKYGKIVIISTNLNHEKIIERYKERVFERIISTTKRVEFKGGSLRK